MYQADPSIAEHCAEHGIVYLIPYHNPWAWMNDLTVDFTDRIIDVIIQHYGLSNIIPIVSSGGSMGGQQALVFCAYSAHNIVGCVVNCPVCDVPFHYTERKDLPSTFYSALAHYNMLFEDALKSISPYHLCKEGKLPRIPYCFFHCDNDQAVNIDNHSVKTVEYLKQQGYDIEYHVVHGKGHCELDKDAQMLYDAQLTDLALNSITNQTI